MDDFQYVTMSQLILIFKKKKKKKKLNITINQNRRFLIKYNYLNKKYYN